MNDNSKDTFLALENKFHVKNEYLLYKKMILE